MHLLVAGGGIAGLASAVALARRGHRVDVFERAPVFGEFGAGIQLGPNATRRLAGLGLADALQAVAARPDALSVRRANDGTELARLSLGRVIEQRYGAPYLCAHRSDLHALLHAAAIGNEGCALHSGTAVERIVAGPNAAAGAGSGSSVGALLHDGRSVGGDGLIVADGVWSTLRTKVVGDASAPRATGHTAWRALATQSALPPDLRQNNVEVWLGARLHVVAYPVRGGEALNVVVLAETVADGALAGDARSWDQPSSMAAMQRAIGNTAGALRALLDAMPAWRAWSLHDRPRVTSARELASGPVALIGDAAHPMLPYLAQGAGMAIEDAVALADALDETKSGADGRHDVPGAFAAYARQRWQRVGRVQAGAQRNGRVFHATGPMRLARDAAMHALGPRLLDQPWLFGG